MGRWEEIERRVMKDTIRLVFGTPPTTFSYAQAEVKVIERRRMDNGEWEIRERSDWTPPVYLHEHSDLALAFSVARPAMAEIVARCMQVDEQERKRIVAAKRRLAKKTGRPEADA